jgi:hypothetical protein
MFRKLDLLPSSGVKKWKTVIKLDTLDRGSPVIDTSSVQWTQLSIILSPILRTMTEANPTSETSYNFKYN